MHGELDGLETNVEGGLDTLHRTRPSGGEVEALSIKPSGLLHPTHSTTCASCVSWIWTAGYLSPGPCLTAAFSSASLHFLVFSWSPDSWVSQRLALVDTPLPVVIAWLHEIEKHKNRSHV